jgi:hypothetical protein
MSIAIKRNDPVPCVKSIICTSFDGFSFKMSTIRCGVLYSLLFSMTFPLMFCFPRLYTLICAGITSTAADTAAAMTPVFFPEFFNFASAGRAGFHAAPRCRVLYALALHIGLHVFWFHVFGINSRPQRHVLISAVRTASARNARFLRRRFSTYQFWRHSSLQWS